MVSNSEYGLAISVSGDLAAIGSGDGSKKVFINRYDGEKWVEEKVLNQLSTGSYGRHLSLSGQNLVVSDSLNNTIYFYQYNCSVTCDWVLVNFKTEASILGFGSQVSLSGCNAIAGADSDTGTAIMYSFKDTTDWTKKQVLTDAQKSVEFGNSVAIKDGVVIVSDNAYNSDTASKVFKYVLDCSGASCVWSANDTLDISPRPSADSSLSVSGAYITVGIPSADEVKVFEYGEAAGPNEISISGAASTSFGFSTSLSDNKFDHRSSIRNR